MSSDSWLQAEHISHYYFVKKIHYYFVKKIQNKA